jgi:hypothetical protein
VQTMVKFRQPVKPLGEWVPIYKKGIEEFEKRLK